MGKFHGVIARISPTGNLFIIPITFSDPLSRSRLINFPSIRFASSLPSLKVRAALSVSILENLSGFPVSDVIRNERSFFLSEIFFDILSRSSDLIYTGDSLYFAKTCVK